MAGTQTSINYQLKVVVAATTMAMVTMAATTMMIKTKGTAVAVAARQWRQQRSIGGISAAS